MAQRRKEENDTESARAHCCHYFMADSVYSQCDYCCKYIYHVYDQKELCFFCWLFLVVFLVVLMIVYCCRYISTIIVTSCEAARCSTEIILGPLYTRIAGLQLDLRKSSSC